MTASQNHTKKIVFVIFTLQGGGAEKFVLTLAETYIKAGHKVSIVLCKNQIEHELPADLSIHVFPYQLIRWIPDGFRRIVGSYFLDRFILSKIGRPDLLVSNLTPVDKMMSLSKLKNLILTVHNTISREFSLLELEQSHRHKLVSNLKSIYSRNNCLYVCVSEGVSEDLIKVLATNPDKVRVIYNPIDLVAITTKSIEFIPPVDNYIVHVGRFKSAKSHEVLIKAYAQTTKKYKLLLVGDGPLLNDMKVLVATLGIDNHVVFQGFQKNPYPYIKNAKFMVLSSKYEGFGIVIGESLALGTPVISTDCESGPRELLPKNNLVPVGDVTALATKIDQAFENTERFTSEFNDMLNPDKIAAAYLSLVNGNSS